MGLRALTVLMEPTAPMVLRATRDRKARRASRENPETLVRPVQMGQMA